MIDRIAELEKEVMDCMAFIEWIQETAQKGLESRLPREALGLISRKIGEASTK